MNAPPVPSRPKRSGPRFLGRYEIIGELARGGMGTVYLARHAGEAGFQRLFAVKVLHAHLVEEAGFVDMLRDEARIAARIHHPNVVAVVDIGTQGDNHYIVMEYVEGPSFATLWKRSRDQRPLEMVVSVMVDTLEGLHAAHTLTDEEGEHLHLVHRDVSPQNILVGVDGVARITDFGIAKAESRITSTQPGMRKGKLQFMSPEQIKDAEKIDLRTDVWAAGVVLYSLLTGEHLFRDENDAATVHNVISKEIPLPSTRGANPPAAFDAIVLRALERDQSKRFESALDMADALRKAAMEAGVLGTRQAVARWVTSTFGEELESRRAAIREVTRRRTGAPPEFREYSQVTVLPSLPSSLTNQLPDGSTPSSIKMGNFDEVLPSEAIVTVPPPPDSPAEAAPLGDPRARQKRMAIGIAVAVVLFALALFLILSSTSKPPEEARHDKPAAAVAAAPVEPVATAAAEAPPAATSAAVEEEPAASEKKAESDKKAKTAVAMRRVVPARPIASVAAPLKPETQTVADPPSPRPTAAPQADFEKNPYLHR
ncbi:MAG TPA: serine/threonine-protein kinase [Polyangiaceae bacterium]|nr:serine/threonine-protein kinase [Polyangiaceae bacterium]